MRHLAMPLIAAALLCLSPASWAKEEVQSVFYDKDEKELTSSELVKLLNKKLDGVYQDLELVITSCFGGEVASRAKSLKGDWSVSTASDAEHKNTTVAGEVKGAGNFKIGGSTFNGWLPAWIDKLNKEGNKIGNKDLAAYATAEKDKVRSGSNPQYASSGKTADDTTLHGGKKSNHAILFQTTGYLKVLDGMVGALKSAGYTDAEINRIPDGSETWAKFEEALDDLRKKLDKNPKEEKAFINLEVHGGAESRTVSYAPGKEGQAGGGAVLTSADPGFTMTVSNSAVLATLGEELLKPGGGVYGDDPELTRFSPATLRLSTFEEHLAGPTAVGLTLNGLSIGSLLMGASGGADYRIAIPDEVLSQVMGDVMSTNTLQLGFSFASGSDWIRIATPEDWADPGTAAMDYGVGIAANCCGTTVPVPEPATWMLMGIGLAALPLVRRRRA